MRSFSRAKRIFRNPSYDILRDFTSSMEQATRTNCDNFSIRTKVTARSSRSTFFVKPADSTKPTISREEYEHISALQDAYISRKEMLIVEGYIGPDADFQVPCRLVIDKEHANIAAMQKQLYFPADENFTDLFTIIYTPDLLIKDYPDQRLIAVDLENYTTRIMGSDYFGESKKGGLRMWNHWVYAQGGLALHAGCKVFPNIEGQEKLALVIGLSGTGKTTTTFRQQLASLPVQDDFCALLPGGVIKVTENGCFAKTYGLDASDEPIIFQALTRSDAWLENVAVGEKGKIDFQDGSYTTNGRGTFRLASIPHRDPSHLPPVSHIFLLNRNQDILPAVVKLDQEQAVDFFMLGETTGTSAGGAAEAGKFLRIPGTNPFFTMDDALQGKRFKALLQTIPDIQVFLLNTGYIGGGEHDPHARKVKIRHSSAIIEAILREQISWQRDPDFGYWTAEAVPSIEDETLLHPYSFYEAMGEKARYQEIVNTIRKSRQAYLEEYKSREN